MSLLSGWTSARTEVRALSAADRDDVLDLCARDPAANVYVAARTLETTFQRSRGALLGYFERDRLCAAAWASANVVPVGVDAEAAAAIAAKIRRQQHSISSVFGPAEQVGALWECLSGWWRSPMDVRRYQPLMVIDAADPLGVVPDPRVRPADMDDLDALVPAAAAMFAEEIGYAPYADRGSQLAYRTSVQTLIQRGHSFVLTDGPRIVFKADIGSMALGACQVQGVWVDPAYRGQGIAAPAMAAVVEYARQFVPLVTLYVNDFNRAARATYFHVGFHDQGLFSTILL